MLIAICDDGQRELEAIEAALTAAALELSAGIEIAPYPSGAALVEAVKGGARPALAVLDIYIGEENGVKTAGVLRGLIPGLPCAFLTTSRDFAVEAFSLDALHYIMKPVTVEKLKELLGRLFTHIERPASCLTLTDGQEDRRFPLAELLAACDYYTNKTHRRISYEYALLRDVNDSSRQAQVLAELLAGRLAHVNLIPVNFVAETGFWPSSDETLNKFAALLRKAWFGY